jgi:alpha-galactosidase
MGDTARYIRSRGLELGLYTTSGNYTCAGQAKNGGIYQKGSGGHQQEDMLLWIREWGVTYIKHCVCNTTPGIRREAFPTMRRAIDRAQADENEATSDAGNTGTAMESRRGIDRSKVVYECANYHDRPWEGGDFEGCNVWRVSADVPDTFDGWTAVVDKAVEDDVNRRAGKQGAGGNAQQQWGGAWSSFDYLRIREKGRVDMGGGAGGQTLDEYRAQMSMWAVLGAPLFIGKGKLESASERQGEREHFYAYFVLC